MGVGRECPVGTPGGDREASSLADEVVERVHIGLGDLAVVVVQRVVKVAGQQNAVKFSHRGTSLSAPRRGAYRMSWPSRYRRAGVAARASTTASVAALDAPMGMPLYSRE